MSLHPTEGARYLLERTTLAADDAGATYAATIYTPEDRFDYRVEMSLDGAYQLNPGERRADPELEAKLEMLVKLTARGAAKKQGDGLPPWPHRLLRWKGPGR